MGECERLVVLDTLREAVPVEESEAVLVGMEGSGDGEELCESELVAVVEPGWDLAALVEPVWELMPLVEPLREGV